MNEPAQTIRYESRWSPALAVLALLFLLEVLPGRFRVLPGWFPYLAAIALLVPMAVAMLTTAKTLWLRIERTVAFLFVVTVAALTIVALAHLISVITLHPEAIGGIPLLSSAIEIWVANVLVFSLLYWQIDRGGPDARANNLGIKPDWLFPQAGAPGDVPPDWRPSFVDYLFLGYSTATAFSPTDALPLTSRAKMLMMIESTIALVTVVVIASRAIGILK